MDPTASPTPSPMPVVLSGSCSCGRVTFTSGSLPAAVTICHCVTCRKLSGNPYLIFGVYHNAALVWAGENGTGAPDIRLTASELAFRGSCSTCSTPLFMKYHCRPDGTSIPMGLIDDASVVGTITPPKEHIFLCDQAKWLRRPEQDTIEHHWGFNDSFQRRLHEWNVRGRPVRADVEAVDVHASRWIFGGRPQIDAREIVVAKL
nr:hypothetical protein CFP56_04158 [Quercus suber]